MYFEGDACNLFTKRSDSYVFLRLDIAGPPHSRIFKNDCGIPYVDSIALIERAVPLVLYNIGNVFTIRLQVSLTISSRDLDSITPV